MKEITSKGRNKFEKHFNVAIRLVLFPKTYEQKTQQNDCVTIWKHCKLDEKLNSAALLLVNKHFFNENKVIVKHFMAIN